MATTASTENDGKCATCFSAASEAGREVRMTDVYDYPVCTLCESRLRNGLIHYRPSNGTEFMIFTARCDDCRHRLDEDGSSPGSLTPPFEICAHGVLDRLYHGMDNRQDHIALWFDPADVDPSTCPALCKRFTHRDDPDGELFDPPPPDVPGQMLFEDVLVVHEPAAHDRVYQESK